LGVGLVIGGVLNYALGVPADAEQEAAPAAA
jgi:hypothetical protein